MQKQEIYLGLGSNQGDKQQNLQKACDLINNEIGQIIGFSSIYNTEAWGETNQEDFLNLVIRIVSELEPNYLLSIIDAIETKLGRNRQEKWGPRTIDIDILYYGNLVIDREHLQVPHAELTERNFVLVPLSEIAPDFIHPIFKLSNKELLEFCTDISKVEKYTTLH